MLDGPRSTKTPSTSRSRTLATSLPARCFIDEVGRLVDFHTDDRWYAGTTPPTRTRWSTPVGDWTFPDEGRPFPTSGSAIWHFKEEFVYARGSFDMFTTDPWDVNWRQN